MPLETATYVPDLNVANPAHTDGLSQADSHMRLLKATLKATFPNFTSVALASTQAQLDLAATQAAGTSVSTIPLGTAALPGLTPLGDPNTGLWSPAADQIAASLGGTQVLLMGGTALVTTLGVAAAAFVTTGAYSGGTGQLVPVGATLLWWENALPAEGGYTWANGQIIASANTVCPVLLARWGSTFGGNGTTTMGVPDMRDCVPVGRGSMGGGASRGLQTLSNLTLGAVIGLANTVLTTLNLPAYTPSGAIGTITSGVNGVNPGAGTVNIGGTGSGGGLVPISSTSGFTGNAQGGTSTAFNNVQPSTTCNYILRLA